MAFEYVMIDTDQMEEGKFYLIYTNKDNAPALIPVENRDGLKFDFQNKRYLDIETTISHPTVQVFEEIEGNVPFYRLVNASVGIKGNTVVIELSKATNGYVVIK
jgi:hypothetical protein